jgi:endonuclease/exonuclease/phosphatase family metal-dependent hydrolase
MVRLLTYNVLEGALPDRLPTVLSVLRDAKADVVAIQEARHWRRNRREAFLEVSRALRMRGLLFKANSGFDLAVFSRLPVVSHANHGLDTSFLHTTGSVTMMTPGGSELTIFVTHLRPDYPYRRREVRLLLRWMRPHRDQLCAMCGDLNSLTAGDHLARRLIRRGSELKQGPRGVIADIERAGWVDCFRLRNPRAPGLTLGAGRRVARVDYIFASKPLAERLLACRVLSHPGVARASDHSPVWAEFDA